MSRATLEKIAERAAERGKPFKILITDDERWVREVFRDYCALSQSVQVDLAKNGQEAVEMAAAATYDLITLDLIMPEGSGLDALTAIKKVQPQTPIMIITGNATDKLVREAGVMGACRVMYKPVQLEDFVNEVAAQLTR